MKASKLAAVGTAVLALAAAAPVVALAKNGGDDPIGHLRNGKDDTKRVRHLASHELERHGRGNDDGPNHR